MEHFCQGKWTAGPVTACASHSLRGRALNLAPFHQRTNVVTEGVAQTGQVSDKGTVSHKEHFDGRMDAVARVRPISVKLSDLRRQQNGR